MNFFSGYSSIFTIGFLIVQVLLVVHVFRNHKPTYWIFLLLFMPFIGAMAYILLEILPEWRSGRQGAQVADSITRMVNPTGQLKALEAQLANANTMANRIAYADELVRCGHYQEGIARYQEDLRGIYADDIDLRKKLATAYTLMGDHTAAYQVWQQLHAEQALKQLEEQLAYQVAAYQAGQLEHPLEMFGDFFDRTQNMEAGYWFTLMLVQANQPDKAKDVVAQMEKNYQHHKHFKTTIGREWIAKARKVIGSTLPF